jgi:drug/metabolite transporter (DMT)-like permease
MLSYEAYVQIGAQRTTLILTLAPVATVIAAWFYLHESLNIVVLFGIIIVLIGAALSVLCKKSSGEKEPASFRGIVLAVAGSVFVGLGAVFSRQAFAGTVHFDATLATAVRVTSGMTFFFLLNLFRRGDEKVRFQMIDRVSARTILLGSIMGPIGGMLCYVGALSISPAGVVSALAATSPVFILGIEAARTRSMPTIQMIAATALTVGGVWIVVSNMK